MERMQKPQFFRLEEIRKRKGYRFTVYDGAFGGTYGNDAALFLESGQAILMTSWEMSKERIALAKAESDVRAVVLYTDRDEFELVCRDYTGSWHLDHWQFPFEWQGKTMNDLEVYMGTFLFTMQRNALDGLRVRHDFRKRQNASRNGGKDPMGGTRQIPLEHEGVDDPPFIQALENRLDSLV